MRFRVNKFGTCCVLRDDGDLEDFNFGELKKEFPIERGFLGGANPVTQKTAREKRLARRQRRAAVEESS
jgi:hypothetical protein